MTVFSLIIYENVYYAKQHLRDFRTFSEVHDYNTRHKENLVCPYTRLTKTEFSGIKFYNALPRNMKMLSGEKFKYELKKFLISACLYNIHDFYSYCNNNLCTFNV